MKVWVFAEAVDDKVTTATLELLTKAREIGSTVEAVYAGLRRLGRDRRDRRFVRRDEAARDRSGRRFAGSGRGGGNRRARGFREPRRDPVRADVRRSRRDRPLVGQARPAGAHQRHVAVGRRRLAGVRHRDLRRRDARRREAHRPTARRSIAIRPEVVRGRGVGRRCGRGRERRRGRRRPCGRGQGARPPRGGAAGSEARRGGGRRLRWSWNRCGRELRAARRGARQVAQGRVGRIARDRRRRLGAVRVAGRPDRQDGEAEGVHRARHLRRDASTSSA